MRPDPIDGGEIDDTVDAASTAIDAREGLTNELERRGFDDGHRRREHPEDTEPEGTTSRRRPRRPGDAAKRPSAAARVEHFTVAERVARGKATRAEVPRASHGDWEPALASSRPGRASRGAGADACARARPDSLRPDARVAVHVLPRCRLPDGLRSRQRAANGPAHPALRRRAPVELRRLRGTRPADGVQHQRLRRDAPGPVRVGRQAARRQLRRRRPRSRLRPEAAGGDQPRGGPGVPRGRSGGSPP